MSKKRSSTEPTPAPKRPYQDLLLEDMKASESKETEHADSIAKQVEELQKLASAARNRAQKFRAEMNAREIETAYAKASAEKDITTLTAEGGLFERLRILSAFRKGEPDNFVGPLVWVGKDGVACEWHPSASASLKQHQVRFTIDREACTMQCSARTKPINLLYQTVQEFLREVMRMCHIPLKHAHHLFPMIFIKPE